VYDVRGRLVRALSDARFAAGDHVVHWDGKDAAGRVAPAGVYLARLSAPGAGDLTRRVVILAPAN
jgi:flagellar hook assembly protein FlgD